MRTIKVIFTVLTLAIASFAYGQLNIKEKIKERSANRAETRTEEGIDKGIDKLEEGVGKLFKKKKDNQEEAVEENEDTSTLQEAEDANKNSEAENEAPVKAPPLLKGSSKYDFIPGDKVLYFEDFSQDAIGDFPALWTTNGGGEVKTVNIAPGNWFHMNKEDAVYCYTKSITFPENFIMEFDIIPDGNFANGFTLTFYEDPENAELTDDLYPGNKGVHVSFDSGNWYSKGYNNTIDGGGWIDGQSATNPVVESQVNHVIIWVQNRRLRIYHQGAKAFDMPTNIHAGTRFNRLRFSGWSTQSTPYVSNIKITTAAPDTRSKLISEGKLVSYGIYFDVNKDVVKAESYGTLNDIANTLKENPTVKIKIIGHTDSDGDDTQNLDLSRRRAASVKNVLSSDFGIDAARIQTDGKGESEPISPNTNTEGKAKNRRVEFLKI